MSLNKTFSRFVLQLPILFAMGSPLTGGASERDLVTYSFEFDLRHDKQHAVVLDFWYGNSRSDWWINWPEELVREGKTLSSEGVTQPMPPGGLLYVKWRDTETGKVYAETVDLRHRVPKNIENHKIYLMIKGAQLYVYLVSPDRRPPDMPINGPSMYDYRKVTTIYPDRSKP